MSTMELLARRVGAGARVSRAADTGLRQFLPVLAAGCLAAGDLVLVFSAFLLTQWPRLAAAAFGAREFRDDAGIGLLVASLTVPLMALQNAYDLERPRGLLGSVHTSTSAVSTALVVAVVGLVLVQGTGVPHLWFAEGWIGAVFALVVWRALAQRAYAAVRHALVPTPRALIVGANPLGVKLAAELADRYHVVGYVDNGLDTEDLGELPLLGPIARLEQVVQANAVDELVVALPAERREQLGRILARGFRRQVSVKFVADLGDMLPHRFAVERVGNRPVIHFRPAAPVSGLKRVADLVLAAVGLLLLAPLFVLVALLIKLDSPGPVFYRQQRVGKNGRRFWMLKFRSMRPDADRLLAELRARNEASGPLFKMRTDPRVTRIGRLLRRYSIDELPQLLNVLKGEMSLIGPRPPLPTEVDKYEDWQFGRLRATPGLTGLWQVSGRSEVPFQDMVRLDLHYIRNWSLGMDIEILLRTIPAILTSRGAY